MKRVVTPQLLKILLECLNYLLFILQETLYRFMLTILNLRFYIRDIRLLLVDLIIFLAEMAMVPFHLFEPHRLSNNDSEIYGEIHYSTLKKALKYCHVQKNNRLLDIGSGKGKAVFFASFYFKLQAIGFDFNDSYITYSRFLKRLTLSKKTAFLHTSIQDYCLPDMDIYLIVGTTFTLKDLNILKNQLLKKTHRFYIISVSEPIKHDQLPVLHSFLSPCSWGFSQIYIQKKTFIKETSSAISYI